MWETMIKGGRKTFFLPPLNEQRMTSAPVGSIYHLYMGITLKTIEVTGLLPIQNTGSLKWRTILNEKLTYYSILVQQAMATWI